MQLKTQTLKTKAILINVGKGSRHPQRSTLLVRKTARYRLRQRNRNARIDLAAKCSCLHWQKELHNAIEPTPYRRC